MTNEKIYRIDITPSSNGAERVTPIANAYGSLAVINYVAKDAFKTLKDTDGTVALTLVEVDHIGGGIVRTVTELTADVETVRFVVERGLRAEKKAVGTDAPAPVEASTDYPTGHDPIDTSDSNHVQL